MARKPPMTPTLDLSDTQAEQSALSTETHEPASDTNAIAKLAAGATIEEAATAPVEQPAPALIGQDSPITATLVSTPDPLVAHLTAQNLEFSKQNQEQSIKLALLERDLADATLKSKEHAELLSGLTTAACAAINLRQIQMGKSSSDLTHLTPQTALAEFNKVHNDFIKTFKVGQTSTNQVDTDNIGEKAPTREEVQNAQRIGKK